LARHQTQQESPHVRDDPHVRGDVPHDPHDHDGIHGTRVCICPLDQYALHSHDQLEYIYIVWCYGQVVEHCDRTGDLLVLAERKFELCGCRIGRVSDFRNTGRDTLKPRNNFAARSANQFGRTKSPLVKRIIKLSYLKL